MQHVHFEIRVGVFKTWQGFLLVIFDIVVKEQIEFGLAWHWWNFTDMGLIDMFFN